MLPPVTRKTLTAAIAALAVTLSLAAPAQALGKNERKFLQGAAAAILIDRLLQQGQRRQPAPQYYTQPRPVAPQPYVQPGRVIGAPAAVSLYHTPAAQGFNNYALAERQQIQRKLAAMGYYRSGIDGRFGPGTFAAVNAYARDTGQTARLSGRDGVFGIYDGLIY